MIIAKTKIQLLEIVENQSYIERWRPKVSHLNGFDTFNESVENSQMSASDVFMGQL